MEIATVQAVSKELSDRLSVKYSDLSEPVDVSSISDGKAIIHFSIDSKFPHLDAAWTICEHTEATSSPQSSRSKNSSSSILSSEDSFTLARTPLGPRNSDHNIHPNTPARYFNSDVKCVKPKWQEYHNFCLRLKSLYLCGASTPITGDKYVILPEWFHAVKTDDEEH